MNTKHTPGPWIADLETWAGIVNAPAGTIAGPVGGSRGATLDELHANARLIAKAPELLDALVRLTAWADVAGCDREPGSILDSNIKAARAVIAQATGE